MASSRAMEWVLLDHGANDPVAVGDVVSVDAGGMPIYRVLGVDHGLLLLEDERHACTPPMPLAVFRWRAT